MSSRALVLGTNENYFDEEVDDQSRTEHMHVMGATGSGKSRFMLSLITQDIINRKGVCLIDPHGELVSHVVDWLSKNEHVTQRRTVKLLQLRDTEHSFGFNPLMVQNRSSVMEINGVVARTVSALAAISGDDGFDGAPLLDKTLTAVCTGLATAGLTLVEAFFLLTPQFHNERKQIISHIKDPIHRREWDALDQLAKSNPKLYQEQFQPAERRISNLIRDPLLRHIIGQQSRNLDVKACMDDREIILVDLSRQGNVVTERSARTFGRFLINALTERAFERNPRDKAPFHLYIDEAHNYLSENIPTILAECRKYGLHLTLAHQNLQQMREAGDAVFHGVMANARNKIVFQLEYPEDAQIMQRRIFAGKYDFEQPIQALIKPTVVGHEIVRLNSESAGESDTRTKSDAWAFSKSNAHATGSGTSEATGSTSGENTSSTAMIGLVDGQEMPIVREATSTGLSNIKSDSSASSNNESYAFGSGQVQTETYGDSHARSASKGWSEALRPIFRDLPTSVYSRDVLEHKFTDEILTLPRRVGYAVLANGYMTRFDTRDTPDLIVSQTRRSRIVGQMIENSSIHSPMQQVEEEVNARILVFSSQAGADDEEHDPWD